VRLKILFYASRSGARLRSAGVNLRSRKGRAGPERAGLNRVQDSVYKCGTALIAQTPVTVVTDRSSRIGDTPIVAKAWGASRKVPFEPDDTKQPWKGEAAACFVCAGITSSRALPTSSVGYWSPLEFSLYFASASGATISSGGDFLRLCAIHHGDRP
jgi:hypothetical protein